MHQPIMNIIGYFKCTKSQISIGRNVYHRCIFIYIPIYIIRIIYIRENINKHLLIHGQKNRHYNTWEHGIHWWKNVQRTHFAFCYQNSIRETWVEYLQSIYLNNQLCGLYYTTVNNCILLVGFCNMNIMIRSII